MSHLMLFQLVLDYLIKNYVGVNITRHNVMLSATFHFGQSAKELDNKPNFRSATTDNDHCRSMYHNHQLIIWCVNCQRIIKLSKILFVLSNQPSKTQFTDT